MKHAFSQTFEEILQKIKQLVEVNKRLAKENKELKSILKK